MFFTISILIMKLLWCIVLFSLKAFSIFLEGVGHDLLYKNHFYVNSCNEYTSCIDLPQACGHPKKPAPGCPILSFLACLAFYPPCVNKKKIIFCRNTYLIFFGWSKMVAWGVIQFHCWKNGHINHTCKKDHTMISFEIVDCWYLINNLLI